MRDLAFYLLKNDRDTPPSKQLHLYRAGQNLEEFPQEWQVPLKARKLSLCGNKLKTLPRRFCAPDLLSLILDRNPIVSLPGSFLSSFGKLRVLDLSGGEFRNLPEELGDLKNLVCLNLSGCGNLEILPDSVSKLQMLEFLDLRFSYGLKYLPEELSDLKNLVWLLLSGCENLEILPDGVRKLHVLKCLDLQSCDGLKYLPSGVGGLTSLQKLCTKLCGNLTWAEHTPSGMGRAESLGYVYPTIGASLEDICALVALTELSICGKVDGGVSFLTIYVHLQILSFWS